MGMRVGDLARRTGVGVSTLRAWEARFNFLNPERSPAGHRVYAETDVERVNTVLRLLGEGLTLAAAIARVANVGPQGLPEGEAEALLYGQILHAAEQGVWVSRDLRTRYVNRRMAEIMGYSIDELVVIPVLDFFDPAEVPLVKERTALVRGGEKVRFTQRLRRADGSMFLAEIHTTPLVNQAGVYEGGVALVTDITERDQRERAMETRDRQSEALGLLGSQVLRAQADPRRAAMLLTEAVDTVCRLLQTDHVTVLEMIADGSSEFHLRAASPEISEAIEVPAGSRSFAGHIALTRKVVVVDNLEYDPRFDGSPVQPGTPTRSAIGAPIFGPDGVRGVLIAESSTANSFHPGDAHFMQGMANIIGTAWLS
jgi:PAS domain S-box-containing protein